ncbi:hypothetical protein RHS01_11067 [Rhizoctonia solani]|uniref:Vegetative incompatibility protein HET-E-1 [Podospora anserina] n=1 Tax=Rhizoctonia solani TaxID=456999 RepID=A0A8H7LZG8_9AGAM|nr:hypothetical protein RHS01_11067 [Rhizoctonia solani]
MEDANRCCLFGCISPDGSRIAAGGLDKAIYMFNAHDGTPALEPLVAHVERILSVAFSPDGSCYSSRFGGVGMDSVGLVLPDSRRMVSASHDGTVEMWNVDDGTLVPSDLIGRLEYEVTQWHSRPTANALLSAVGVGRSYQYKGINSLTFSSDGRFIVSHSFPGGIRVFDSHSCDFVLGPLDEFSDRRRSAVFSPDGNYIVSGSSGGSVRIWRVEGWAPAYEPLEGHQDLVCSLAYSPDGAYIVSASEDSTIRVWKAPGRRPSPAHPNMTLRLQIRESHMLRLLVE